MKKKNNKKINKNKKFNILSILCEILLISLFVAGAYACLIKYDVVEKPTFNPIKKEYNLVENVNIGIGEKFNVNTGDELSKDLLWRSLDNDIATVDNGVVEGKAIGETNVTLTMKDGETKTFYIYVNDNNIPERAGTTSQDIYVIYYNANGGKGVSKTTTCKSGNSCAVSGNLYTKEGYKFIGWSTNANGKDDGYNWTGWSGTWKFTNGTKGIKENKLYLYARWEKNNTDTSKKYTITYNSNGGSGSMSTQTCTYGEKCTIKGNEFTKSGYTFTGFATSTSGQGYNWTGWSGTWKFTNGQYGIKNNKLVLYARWKKSEGTEPTQEAFTIRYLANGGKGTMSEQTCYKGQRCEISANKYTKSGYKFTKWRTTSSTSIKGYNWTGWKGTWNFTNGQYGINNNTLTLYATWEKTATEDTGKTFTIKYMPNGATNSTAIQVCKTGEKCTIKDLKVFSRTGYNLVKWRTTSDNTPGYNWTGWSGTWNFKNGQYGIKDNTLILYATWQKKETTTAEKYTVYYYANGGSGSQMTTTKCTSGKTCSIKNCDYSRNGYTFAGWTTNSNGNDDGYKWTGWSGTWTYTNGQYGITANTLKLYARWEKKNSSNKFTIKYNANGGTGEMKNTTCNTNKTCTIKSNEFKKSGYKFKGWTTNSNGKDDGYGWTGWSGTWTYKNGEYGIKNNKVTLYARWEKKDSGTSSGYVITEDTNFSSYQEIASCSGTNLKYRIVKISDAYYVLVWAKDARTQLNNALAKSNAQGTASAESILNSEISSRGLSSKCLVAVNASFFSGGTPESNVVIHSGKVVKSVGDGKSSAVIGINNKGTLTMYKSTTGNEMLSEGVYATFKPSSHVSADKGTVKANRTQIYQVDTNNFILVSSGSSTVYSGLTNVKKYFNFSGDGFNLDGGGSRKLYYKTKSGSVTKVFGGDRAIPDMLYFSE